MYTLSTPLAAQNVTADSPNDLASWAAVAGRLGVVTLCDEGGVRLTLDFSRHDLADPFCWRGGRFWPLVLRVECKSGDPAQAFARAFTARAGSQQEAADRLHARLTRKFMEPARRGDIYPAHSVVAACAGPCHAQAGGPAEWRAGSIIVTPPSAPVRIVVVLPHAEAASERNWTWCPVCPA